MQELTHKWKWGRYFNLFIRWW